MPTYAIEECQLHEKKVCNLAFKKVEKDFMAEKGHVNSETLDNKLNVKALTLEEKMQEASKPLYLRRYE